MMTITSRVLLCGCLFFKGDNNSSLLTHPHRPLNSRSIRITCANRNPNAIIQPQVVQQEVVSDALDLLGLHCSSGLPQDVETLRTLYHKRDVLLPAFEVILTDPKSDPIKVSYLFHFLAESETSSRRYCKLAAARLSDKERRVRNAALNYLEKYGSSEFTPKVVALLSDNDRQIRFVAARTLASHGAKCDLEAIDAWLKNGKHPNEKDYIDHVKKCRDELEKRLKEHPVPKNLMN
jgi:hypothetical protein